MYQPEFIFWEESFINTKSFNIPKALVWCAWKRVKANGGRHGVDQVSLKDFEADLKNNLYKLWNRLSSGSYMPLPVRRVNIPKGDGTIRPLGIPTITDRIAQQVVKSLLESEIDPHFHPNSYGYRPGKSAIDAVTTARKRVSHYDWVIDADIQGFFDNIDHGLLMKAVKRHTKQPWICLYIERWLTASVKHPNGELETRDRGTPQGGVISPLLANLFLHYAIDNWAEKQFEDIVFERYADDVVFHCHSYWEAEYFLKSLTKRLEKCGLKLHPDKTKIVYCKDSNRLERYKTVSFDFLGFTFKPRRARNKWGENFTAFTPAMSQKSFKRITESIKALNLLNRSDVSKELIAFKLNPKIRGWFNYFKHFGKFRLYWLAERLDFMILLWVRRKYKRTKRSYRKGGKLLKAMREQQPKLFAHWYLLKQD